MSQINITIPCRNEVRYIEACIRAIYQSEGIENHVVKVFIVDGMSDDGTREVLKTLCDIYNGLRIIDNIEQITPVAFNLGIKTEYESADYIQIIGARHIISPNYLKECLRILETKKDVWCVGGKLINEYTNDTSRVIAKAMASKFGMGIGNFRTLETTGYTDTVTSPMYPRWVLDKIGFFDENLVRNQDDDFNYRLSQAGGKIYFIHDISIRYYIRTSLSHLRTQFFQYGYWKVFVNRKHKAITTVRQLVPGLFTLFVLTSPLFIFLLPIVLPIYIAIALLYIFCCIYYSLSFLSDIPIFITSLCTYPTLHFSYGWGYLSGIMDFLIKNISPNHLNKRLSR
jgi:GT2 family glycosyltransferase